PFSTSTLSFFKRPAAANFDDSRTNRLDRLRHLVSGDAQWRHQHNDVPNRPREKSVLPGCDTNLGSLICQGSFWQFCYLYPSNKSTLPHFSHTRNIRYSGELGSQASNFWLQRFQDAFFFKYVQTRLGCDATDRLASVAMSVSQTFPIESCPIENQ